MAEYQNLSSVEDASAKYFWTIDAYEQVKQDNYNDYVPVTTDSKAVYKDFEVRYHVRVWKRNGNANAAVTPFNPAIPLRDGDGVTVFVRDSWKTSVAADVEVGSVVQASAGSSSAFPKNTNGIYPYYVDDSNTGNKEIFYFNIKAKKSNIVIQPKIYVRLDANSSENSNNYPLEVLPGSSNSVVPTIKFTKAQEKKSVPKKVLQDAWRDHLIALDKCSNPNRWVAIVKELDINPDGVNWYLYYYPLDVDQQVANGEVTYQKEWMGYDSVTGPNAPLGPDKISSFGEAEKKLLQIKTDTCKEFNVEEPTDPGFSSSKPVIIGDYANRTNPPTHFSARDVKLWDRIKARALKDMGGNPLSEQRLDILREDYSQAGRLGMIMQDNASAKALNKYDPTKPWGFRFMYNPSIISYRTEMDTTIDWMLADKDPANYIGGNVAVGFTLYLNRMPDMTDLGPLKGKPGPFTGRYARTLEEAEIQGILHRGTEYDLEFLYRVVNGDPEPSIGTLLNYTALGKPALTSDFGYITGTPIWLKIHENMKYKGSVASMAVTHHIFNEFMVPMLSTVDISIVRYPVIGDVNEDVEKAFNEKRTKYNTADTGKTAGTE